MNRIFLLFVVSCCTLSAQTSSRSDLSAGFGATLQFAKVINKGLSVGPHAHAQFAWRVKDTSGLSLTFGYDFVRSAFGALGDSLDAEAHFFSFGLRAETHSFRAPFNPYLCIAASYGIARQVIPDQQADPQLRHTAVMFGVGFTLNIWEKTAIVPLARFVISEGAAVSIPLTCSLRWDL